MLVKLYIFHLTPHFFNRNRCIRAVNLSLKVLPVSKQTITEVFFPAVRPSLKPDNGLNMTSWIWEMRKVIGDRRMLVWMWKDGIIDHVGGHLSLPLPERLCSEPELLTGFERSHQQPSRQHRGCPFCPCLPWAITPFSILSMRTNPAVGGSAHTAVRKLQCRWPVPSTCWMYMEICIWNMEDVLVKTRTCPFYVVLKFRIGLFFGDNNLICCALWPLKRCRPFTFTYGYTWNIMSCWL